MQQWLQNNNRQFSESVNISSVDQMIKLHNEIIMKLLVQTCLNRILKETLSLVVSFFEFLTFPLISFWMDSP